MLPGAVGLPDDGVPPAPPYGIRSYGKIASDRPPLCIVLFYTHTDRAPNAFWESATWSLDASGRIVSMAVVGSSKTRVGAPALFIANSWSQSTITLVADTVKTPSFEPNQFTCSVTGDHLKMVWEVSRNGVRAVGGSLLRTRAPGDR